jgi:nucleotide-binding universal stress UspA family protein
MRRILVPLDGTYFGAKIIPDALRLAGSDGVLVLVQDVTGRGYSFSGEQHGERVAMEEAERYLENIAEAVRSSGASVETHGLALHDVAFSIDEAAKYFKTDMVVCATHGRTPLHRLLLGSVAWRAVAHSSVPVMLRHIEPGGMPASETLGARRILVPLDGSKTAKAAMPIADQLAVEWQADVWLVRVIPQAPVADSPFRRSDESPMVSMLQRKGATEYLKTISAKVHVPVHPAVLAGQVVDVLVKAVEEWDISDVVIGSHGRTGLSRLVLGSITDALVHRLDCPIFVVPAQAASSVQPSTSESQPITEEEPLLVEMGIH